MDLPPLPTNLPAEAELPPPLPVHDEVVDKSPLSSPMSNQMSARGTKRADIDNDSGGPSPSAKIARLERSEHVDLHVIDDIQCSDGDDDDDDEEEDDGQQMDSDSEAEWVGADEIDALLDEGVKDYQQKKEEMAMPLEREKVVLVEKFRDYFDILPEGWVELTHNSGMPLYLHKESRVCTLSRPYFLGPGSARKHDIPMSAIPCLQYRRALNNENKAGEVKLGGSVPASNSTNEKSNETAISDQTAEKTCQMSAVMPQDSTAADCQNNDSNVLATVEEDTKDSTIRETKALSSVVIATAEEYHKNCSLSPEDVQKYCESLFQFKTITVKRFRSWRDRRKYNLKQKLQNRPSVPTTTKLITCPVPLDVEKPIKKIKEVVLNPVGKSSVCILHEYVQHALRLQPKFSFAETENAQMPYSASVSIDGTNYGVGYGSCKKMAKSEAAKKTLDILLPELSKLREKETDTIKDENEHDMAFFNEVRVDDPRVNELCNKSGQPNPYSILGECIRRNHGLCDMDIHMEMKTLKENKTLKHQKSEFIMKVGKHEAKVVVKNKREGKQQAAQQILKLLHPHIHCWGSLLRLYGSTNKMFKEKKAEEHSITELQSKASEPSKAIIQKLREEMLKLAARKESMKSRMKGAFDIETTGFKFTEPNSIDL